MQVYLPGQELEEGFQLDVDLSVYEVYQPLSFDWPCLSFDILSDNLGNDRVSDPFSLSFVAGTQASKGSKNSLVSCTLSSIFRNRKNLKKLEKDVSMEESDDEEDEDSDSEEELEVAPPVLNHSKSPHEGGVNRLRIFQDGANNSAVASWSENGFVQLYGLTAPPTEKQNFTLSEKPFYRITSHLTEGYSLAWSSFQPKLLSGDCKGSIVLSEVSAASATSKVFTTVSHCSIEDIEWSHRDENIFSTCSTDGYLRVFDQRASSSPIMMQQVSNTDVNVLSWNKTVSHLIATGDDSGVLLVTDMRMCDKGDISSTLASFKWHRGPISSIEWNPNDSTLFAASGLDHQITIWDLSLEQDQEEMTADHNIEVPDQLLFIHQGQTDIKEIHWHKQIPGLLISTAADGFNIFKTINI
jgi:ribosome assembly protein RRB1